MPLEDALEDGMVPSGEETGFLSEMLSTAVVNKLKLVFYRQIAIVIEVTTYSSFQSNNSKSKGFSNPNPCEPQRDDLSDEDDLRMTSERFR